MYKYLPLITERLDAVLLLSNKKKHEAAFLRNKWHKADEFYLQALEVNIAQEIWW